MLNLRVFTPIYAWASVWIFIYLVRNNLAAVLAHFLNNASAVVVYYLFNVGTITTDAEEFGATDDWAILGLSLVGSLILLWGINYFERNKAEKPDEDNAPQVV